MTHIGKKSALGLVGHFRLFLGLPCICKYRFQIAECFAQTLSHRVDRGSEHADLIIRFDFRAYGQVAAGDLLGDAGEPAQRTHDVTPQEECHRQPKDSGDQAASHGLGTRCHQTITRFAQVFAKQRLLALCYVT